MIDRRSEPAFTDACSAELPASSLPGFKVDLRYSKTRWSRKVLAARLVWACLVKPIFMLLPRPFSGLRIMLLRLMGARIGEACHVEPRIKVLMPWNLEMGDHAAVGRETEFLNFDMIRIGDMTVVSQHAYLCTGTHDYTHPHFPLRTAPIAIGPQCWVAARAFIGPGVTIGEGAVIGAAAVVTKDMPAWMVCAGNPCVPLKQREIRTVEES